MATYFKTQASGLYGGIRSYTHRLPHFSRTAVLNANRSVESGRSNLHMTPDSGMALKKPLFAIGASSIAGTAVAYISSGISPEVMDTIVSNSSTITGIAAGVVSLGAVSLAASIRQNMYLGRENRKLGSVGNNNKRLTSAINDVLLPMLKCGSSQSLADKIIALTGGKLNDTNKSVVDALSHSVLPGILTSEESGAGLARLLFTNIAVENPLEFIQALYQNSEGKWALTNSNLAVWQGERSENLLAESQSIAQSCGEHDVKAFEKALALAEQAQDEQENPEIQGTITALRAKVAQLNSASNYTIQVPVDKWNAIFLGIWRSLSLSDKELVSAIPTNNKYVLAVELTNAQIWRLTQALQEYEDMTITRLSSGDIHGRN